MQINLLSQELRNQIAAGEVIENPSSVLKELIENSIDANSDEIIIKLENYGLSNIIIEDNGDGIEEKELSKAPLRHATSKINNLDDLYSIKTFGFRGEALSSIFSVSKAQIYTKTKKSKTYKIEYKNKKVEKALEKDNLEKPSGTKIIVKELFFNTPARKKYLNSDLKEFKNLLNIIENFAYIHFNVSFKIFNNNQIVFYKPKLKNLEENIFYLLKKSKKTDFIKIENEFIKGFIGDVNLTYNNKKKQYLYVNNRFVKNKLIEKAIYEAYGHRLMGKHPFFILNIQIDPKIIDVNIHPKKLEIKFENELFIFKKVKDIILNSLKDNIKIPSASFDNKLISDSHNFNHNNNNNDNTNLNQNQKNYSYQQDFNKVYLDNKKEENYKDYNYDKQKENNNLKSKYYQKTSQKELILNENSQDYQNYEDYQNYNYNKQKEKEKQENTIFNDSYIQTQKGPLYDFLSEYKILGQFNKTYILIENSQGLVILDQHVIEEKNYFEIFKKQKHFTKINVLNPISFKLTEKQKILIKEQKNFLETFFNFETKNDFLYITKIAQLFNKEIDKNFIFDIFDENLEKQDFENNFYDKIASKSCRKSIKAGYELTNYEIKKLIEKLKHIQEPYSCPHGRPILMKITNKEIEKFFKRVV